ncbi:MAG: hypothetical protein KJO44_10915 [Gemmatimonadetes bacterium]|nr:hypothetical protein [Gemmatimonadota bacterium]
MSNLTVTAVASSRLMCLRSDVETELGITAGSENASLHRLILAASMAIADELGREPWLQTYLERLPGNGGVNLHLSRWPLKGKPSSITLGTGDSPSTVTAADYSLGGRRHDYVYMANGWNLTERDGPRSMPVDGDRSLDYNVAYSAGWVMPDEISVWTSEGAVAANSWWRSTDSEQDDVLIFQADGAGSHDATEPTWPTVSEGTVDSDDFTYTAYEQRLPEPLMEACLMLTVAYYEGALAQPVGISEERAEGRSIKYAAESKALSGAVAALVGPYK